MSGGRGQLVSYLPPLVILAETECRSLPSNDQQAMWSSIRHFLHRYMNGQYTAPCWESFSEAKFAQAKEFFCIGKYAGKYRDSGAICSRKACPSLIPCVPLQESVLERHSSLRKRFGLDCAACILTDFCYQTQMKNKFKECTSPELLDMCLECPSEREVAVNASRLHRRWSA